MKLMTCRSADTSVISVSWAKGRWMLASTAVMIASFFLFNVHFQLCGAPDFYALGGVLLLNIVISVMASSTRIELNDAGITRKSLLGRTLIPFKDISSAEIASIPLSGGWRKANFLILQTAGRTLSFSTGDHTVYSTSMAVSSKKRLFDIQSQVLDAGAKQDHTIAASNPAHTGAFLKSWKTRERAEIVINTALIAGLMALLLSGKCLSIPPL
jgi:hypothetical protein